MASCAVTYDIGYKCFRHDRLEIKSVEKQGLVEVLVGEKVHSSFRLRRVQKSSMEWKIKKDGRAIEEVEVR